MLGDYESVRQSRKVARHTAQNASREMASCIHGLCGAGQGGVNLRRLITYALSVSYYYCIPFDGENAKGHPVSLFSGVFHANGTSSLAVSTPKFLIDLSPAAFWASGSNCLKNTLAHEAMHIAMGNMTASDWLFGADVVPKDLRNFAVRATLPEKSQLNNLTPQEEYWVAREVDACIDCTTP